MDISSASGGYGRSDITAAATSMRKPADVEEQLERLAQHLQPSDTVLVIARGYSNHHPGLLVLTRENLIFVPDQAPNPPVQRCGLADITGVVFIPAQRTRE